MNNINDWIRRKILLFPVLLCLLFINILPARADEASFRALFTQLAQEGIVPNENGQFLSFGEFEDGFVKSGYCSVTPFLKAKRFVLSAEISWTSGNQTSASEFSGCGMVFNAAEEGTDHVMASARMDGALYISGIENGKYLSFAKFPNVLSSSARGTKLVLAVNGSEAVVYLDGVKKSHRYDLPVWGNSVGLSVLSGKCVFKDIEFYSW